MSRPRRSMIASIPAASCCRRSCVERSGQSAGRPAEIGRPAEADPATTASSACCARSVAARSAAGRREDSTRAELREERRDDARLNHVCEDARRCGAAPRGMLAPAPVLAQVPLAAGDRVGLHDVPTARAPEEAGQERAAGRAERRDGSPGQLRRTPLRLRDQRGMGAVLVMLPGPGLAGVHGILDHVPHGARGPCSAAVRSDDPGALEDAGELFPRRACGSPAEQVGDRRRGARDRLQPAVGAPAIARRRSAGDVDASVDGRLLCPRPGVADPVNLELCQRQDHVKSELARRRAGVEPLLDADQPATGVVDAPERRGSSGHAGCDAVELRHDDAVGFARLDPRQGLLESWLWCLGAGLVQVVVPRRDVVAVEGAERVDLVSLRPGGDEALTAPMADSDVAGEVHRSGVGRLAALVLAKNAGHVCHHVEQGCAEWAFLRRRAGVAVALCVRQGGGYGGLHGISHSLGSWFVGRGGSTLSRTMAYMQYAIYR